MSFGFGFALPHWQTLSGGFSPASLFSAGEQGAWYDPSDSSTLFSDTAGTTPSPTPGGGALSVVGLMLDKSQGGRQALPITGWVQTSGDGVVTVNGGIITITGATTTTRVDINAPGWLVGNLGEITINGTVGSAVGPAVYVGGGNVYTVLSGSNVYRNVLASSALCRVQITSGSATFDVTSRSYAPGNHAISYNTTTARPELSARVNLLLNSENFSGTGWSVDGMSLTASAGTAPDGSNTATSAALGTGNNRLLTFDNTGVLGNKVFSIYVKPNTGNTIDIQSNGGMTPAATAVVNASTGVVTGFTGASTTFVGDGWYRVILPVNVITASGNSTYWQLRVTTGSVLIWGAQLISTNQFPANTYQRIADQYTYDSSGFPRYLVFNGTASGMYTPANLNLSGTGKATVFAGVRKLVNAAQAIVELSANAQANAGAFYVFNTSTANYEVFSRGSVLTGVTDPTVPTAAPSSNVVTGQLSIQDNIRNKRVNGVLVNQDSGNQGTGNFGTYPLNIGVRSAAATPSLFLNGYLYSLIVVGAASTAAQISSTESWINVKEGGVY